MTEIEIYKKVLEIVSEKDETAHYGECLDYLTDDTIKYKRYYRTIFSHDFAKAFWGEDRYIGDEWWIERTQWQHHLEVMVLEEEPLKYLEKFL